MKIGAAELTALGALDEARSELEAQETDRIGRDETGEAYGYMSSGLTERVATDALAAVDIEVDLEGVEVIGATVASSWSWRYGGWRSKVTRIQLPTAQGMSPRGMVTLGRKLFLIQLLRVRVAQHPAADVASAADSARGAVYDATRELFRAHVKRHKLDEAAALEAMTGVPQPHGSRLTYEMLPAQAIGWLYARLLMVIGGASVGPGDDGAKS